LATKDHFSSNWTSRVFGGKSHALVVDVPGVAAGLQGQADHRVFVDAAKAAGLADADALLEVGQDGDGLVFGEAAVEQGRALALAEAVLAGPAGQIAPLFTRAVAEGDAEVAQAAPAVVGALGALAAEGLEVFHGASYRKQEPAVAITLPLR
jgi:hypothetical protein